MDGLLVSVDVLREIHDNGRGVSGSYSTMRYLPSRISSKCVLKKRASKIIEPEMSSKKKKILIIYIGAGAGHLSYSRAIYLGLQKMSRGKHQIKEMEYVEELGPESLVWAHREVWKFLLRHPTFGMLVYHFCEKFWRLTRTIGVIWTREHIQNSIRFIDEYRPDIIVAPHPHTLHVAVITRRVLGQRFPIIGVNIEPFDGVAYYAHPEANYIIVFSEEAKRKLMKRGVPEEKLLILDFIVQPKFLKVYGSQATVKKRLGLDPEFFTLVMTSGGEGIGNFERYVRATIRNDLPVQLVIITGKNTVLKEKLERLTLPKNCSTKIQVLGFVEDINDYFYAADVLFGKGGASTTVESLFMRKAIMCYKYVMGHEKRSVMFIKRNKLGWYVPRAGSYIRRLKEILQHPDILEKIKERYGELDFKSGTDTLCRLIIDTLEAAGNRRESL